MMFEFCQDNLQSGSRFREGFESIWRSGELIDVTVRIENRTFDAHRLILASVFPFFRAQFRSNRSDSRKKNITLEDFDADAFECLLNFAYTGKIRIRGENVRHLLVAADFLLLTEVQEACFAFLETQFSPDNVLDLFIVGDKLNRTDFVEKADVFIRENFDAVYRTNGFLNLPLYLLKEIVSKTDLHVGDDGNVFEAIAVWVKAKPSERMCFLFELWNSVQKQLLPAEPNLNERHRKPAKTDLPTIPDLSWSNDDVFSIYTICSSPSDRTVHNFNSITQEWSTVAKHNQPRSFTTAVSACGMIYALTTYDLQMFNGRSWYSCGLLPWSVRSRAGNAVSHGNRIFWFPNIVSEIHSVWCFDTENNIWTEEIPSLRMISAGFVSSFPSRLIYILGGATSSPATAEAKTYDTYKKDFDVIRPMLTRRNSPGCAILKDEIYVCGGSNGFTFLDTAEVYDTFSGEWRYISRMLKAKINFSLVPYDGLLYAINKEPNGQVSVEVCDPEENKKWICGPDFGGIYNSVKAVTISF